MIRRYLRRRRIRKQLPDAVAAHLRRRTQDFDDALRRYERNLHPVNLDLLDARQRLVLITALTSRWLGQDADDREMLTDGCREGADMIEVAERLATSATRLDVIRHLAHGRIPDNHLPDPGPQGDAAL
jgi:hypothetical protein